MDLENLINQISEINEKMQTAFDEMVIYFPEMTEKGFGWKDEIEAEKFKEKFDDYLNQLEKFFRLNKKLNTEVEKAKMEREGKLISPSKDDLVWSEFRKKLPKKLRELGYKDVKTFEDAIRTVKMEMEKLYDVAKSLLKEIDLDITEKVYETIGVESEEEKAEKEKREKFREVEKTLFG